MATQVQFRRGTSAQHQTFKGALGEITVDTTKSSCVVHDAVTTGGFPLFDVKMGLILPLLLVHLQVVLLSLHQMQIQESSALALINLVW